MRRALALCALLLVVVTACGSPSSDGGPPLLVVDLKGEGHLSTGVKSAAEIRRLVERYRGAG